MSILTEFREWLMLIAELFICYMLVLEYNYDAAKDNKRSRRTKTIKKATTNPDGSTVTEENVETIESNKQNEN